MRRDPDRDRGAVALAVVMVALVVAGSALVATVHTAEVLVAHARARTAADAVALAGVAHGRDVAEAVAGRNGAVIESWTSSPVPDEFGATSDQVVEITVVVRVGDAVATARATNGP